MGCSSSTEVVVDPHTGQTKTKKRLGGAYPGQRPTTGSYTPEVGPNGQATAHFQAVGGGNALQLVQGNGKPVEGAHAPQFIQVTLPKGVSEGQTIHVQAPDGSVNAIIVPPGYGPGSSFTVEFAPTEPAGKKPTAEPYPSSEPYSVPPPTNTGGEDGFASGFGSTPTAQATTTFSDSYYAQYSSQPATAVPVYNNKY